MKRYRPIATAGIEAMQWTGNNWPMLAQFAGRAVERVVGGTVLVLGHEGPSMTAAPGDWIAKDAGGTFHPIADAVFRQTWTEDAP